MPYNLRTKLKHLACERDITVKECERLIKALDTVDTAEEIKTGHWIEVTNGRGGHECNICHEYAPSYRNGDEYLTKYCPNCGEKMIDPQESEDKE